MGKCYDKVRIYCCLFTSCNGHVVLYRHDENEDGYVETLKHRFDMRSKLGVC